MIDPNDSPESRPESDDTRQTLVWHEGDMPYSTSFGDHFYCRTDGRLECGHVFLNGNGLPQRWTSDRLFRIGELGFGTGLNLCETWRQWKETRMPGGRLHFTSFELYPMSAADLDKALARFPEIKAESQALFSRWPEAPRGHVDIELDDTTHLTVVCDNAMTGIAASEGLFDAWYLDGFAPARNPDMWSAELIQLLHEKTVPGGSFATYAAAGFVRRNLAAAGFQVERRKGFANKREMLCGTKTA